MYLLNTGLTEDEIKSIELFKFVDIESIRGLLENCSTRKLEAEEIFIKPGMQNEAVYFLLKGKLRIHLTSPDSEPLVIFSSGESVGEMSVIDQELTSAYVIAQEPCRLLVMEEDILWSLVQSSHAAACNLLFILTKRLRHTDFVVSENVKVEHIYQRYGSVDALTGLHNRHWLDNALNRYCNRFASSKEALSVLMIDIDKFKDFNDTYGHLHGDRLLYRIAHTISEHLRPSEVITRYGGDEFVVLLPDIDLGNAINIARRLHDAVRKSPLIENEDKIPLPTISIGVAQLQVDQTPEKLLCDVDAALYRAKKNGRNCTSD